MANNSSSSILAKFGLAILVISLIVSYIVIFHSPTTDYIKGNAGLAIIAFLFVFIACITTLPFVVIFILALVYLILSFGFIHKLSTKYSKEGFSYLSLAHYSISNIFTNLPLTFDAFGSLLMLRIRDKDIAKKYLAAYLPLDKINNLEDPKLHEDMDNIAGIYSSFATGFMIYFYVTMAITVIIAVIFLIIK